MFFLTPEGLFAFFLLEDVFENVIESMLGCVIILSRVCKGALCLIKLCAASLSRQRDGNGPTGTSDSCLRLIVIQTLKSPNRPAPRPAL